MKKMSQKQIEANKNNSLLGGVKTEEGKMISKFNALKHGILRESVTDYENLDYSIIYNSLVEDFKPQNTIEEMLIERITISYIKLMRITKAESEAIKKSTTPSGLSNLDYPIGQQGYLPKVTEQCITSLSSVYSRYETTAENRLYKAMNKLLELKQNGK